MNDYKRTQFTEDVSVKKPQLLDNEYLGWLTRNRIWRGLVLFSLVSAAVIVGTVSHRLVSNYERKLFESEFSSTADDALRGVERNLQQRISGNLAITTVYSYNYRNANDWPFVYFDGFTELANFILEINNGRIIHFMPIVLPSQVQQFEEHAIHSYSKDQHVPSQVLNITINRGMSSLGIDQKGWHYSVDDVSGNNIFNSPNKILTPILQSTLVKEPQYADVMMSNTHYVESFGSPIDLVINCSNFRKTGVSHQGNCGVFGDLIMGSSDNFNSKSVLIQPIYPKNNATELVGFIQETILWFKVLAASIPNWCSSIDCVISTNSGNSITYSVANSVATFVGNGDLHDRSFSKSAESLTLDLAENLCGTSTIYTITFYPTKQYYDRYAGDLPIKVSMGAVAIILFTGIVFCVYDYFMKAESNYNRIILDTKRRFVRFISHEVRTPLNTVALGMKLITAELGELSPDKCIDTAIDDGSSSPLLPNLEKSGILLQHGKENDIQKGEGKIQDCFVTISLSSVKEWMKLAEDIGQNVEDAVNVLNDLLYYDKIETGSKFFSA